MEVFETIFAVGSTHNGTVVRIDGNQATVALPYGLEGSCHTKHLQKDDGGSMLVDESGEFTVLEFNRNAKRITVSHLRTHEEGPKKKETKERKTRPATAGGSTSSRALEEINATVEKSTFGDLSVLSALKEQMEGGERKAKAEAEAEAEAKVEAAPKKKATAKAKAAEAPAEAPAEESAPEAAEGAEGEASAEAES